LHWREEVAMFCPDLRNDYKDLILEGDISSTKTKNYQFLITRCDNNKRAA